MTKKIDRYLEGYKDGFAEGYERAKSETITYFPNISTTNEEQPCLWGPGMPENFPGSGTKIGQLSCPCPKCSPRC